MKCAPPCSSLWAMIQISHRERSVSPNFTSQGIMFPAPLPYRFCEKSSDFLERNSAPECVQSKWKNRVEAATTKAGADEADPLIIQSLALENLRHTFFNPRLPRFRLFSGRKIKKI